MRGAPAFHIDLVADRRWLLLHTVLGGAAALALAAWLVSHALAVRSPQSELGGHVAAVLAVLAVGAAAGLTARQPGVGGRLRHEGGVWFWRPPGETAEQPARVQRRFALSGWIGLRVVPAQGRPLAVMLSRASYAGQWRVLCACLKRPDRLDAL